MKERIIILSDKQEAELIRRADALGFDDCDFLQLHLNKWLKTDSIEKALTDGLRLNHTEK